MRDYDPSEFRLTGAKVVAAWLAAVVCLMVMAATFFLAEPASRTIDHDLVANYFDRG